MSLLHEPTAAESRLLIREKSIRDVAEAANNLVSIMLSAHQQFWAVEPVQLVEDLNAELESSLSLMAANTALATTANASLDLLNLPQYTKRVPTEIGNPNITFDGTAFVYTAPPIIEPEPAPEL